MKKISIGILTLAILLTAGGFALAAAPGGKIKGAGVGLAARSARQAAIQAALDAGDYNAWVKAVGAKNPLLKKITADNFSLYVQYKKLMKEGKYTEAQTIGRELGIVKISKNYKKPGATASGEKGQKKGWLKKYNKAGTTSSGTTQ